MSSTVKKPNNSKLSQPQLGQYRQLGPKIHEFGAGNHNNQQQQQQQTQQKQYEQEQKHIMPQQSQGNQANNKHSRQTQSNGVPAMYVQEQKNAVQAAQNIQQAVGKNKEFKVQSSTNSLTGQATMNRQQQNQMEQTQHRQQVIYYSQQQQSQQQHQYQKSKNDLIPPNHQSPTFGSNTNSNAASRLPTQENNNNEDGTLNYKQLLDNQHDQPQTQQEDEGLDGVDSLKAQLRTIFDFYTTFGDRQNLSSLKSSKFYKMMSDAGVLSQTLSSTRLDLLFCQTNKHNPNMSFNTFLEMLPKLSLLKYPQLTQEEAMLALITQQLNPLYVSIMEKTDLGLELRSFAQPLEIDCIEILTPLYPMLQKIYESYFPWERANSMTKEKAQARSLKALFVFLAEYNICPTHFNKSTGFLLFNYLIDLVNLNVQFAVTENPTMIFGFQDFGKSFTFQRFLVYLIRSSIISYENRLDAQKYPCSSHLEKLNLLLERMEISEGNLNIQRKTHSTNNQHSSLLIPESLVMQLSVNKSIDWSTPRASQFGTYRSKMNSGISSSRQQSSIMSALSPKRSNSSHRKSLLLDKLAQSFVSSTNAFEKHNEALIRIFRAYCAYGEPMNQSTLKTIKLIRLLTDARIMKKTKNSQTNMSLLNSSGVSKKGGIMLSSSTKRPSSGQISLSASGNKKQLNNQDIDSSNINKEDRFLSKIDMDFMVAKLTGSKWIQQFNKESTSFNRKIQSPKLGFSSYLHRTDDATGAKGKIEYEHFLKLLEMISEKLLPELDAETSLQVIIEQILTVSELPDSPANQNTSSSTSQHRKTMQDYLLVLMDTLKDSEIVQLLGEVHLSLLIYYKIYQDMHGYMNITQFLKFFKDFEIFPAMASKPKLSTIFYALAQVQANQSNNNDNTQLSREQRASNNNNNTPTTQNQSQMSGKSSHNRSRFLNESSSSISGVPDQSESELIDQHLFVEAIALLAIDIYTEQPSNVFKIIMILERMNNSEGPTRIQKQLGHTRSTDGQHWDMLHSIRRKYPEFYQSKRNNNLNNQISSSIQAINSTNHNNTNNHSDSQFLSPAGTRQGPNTFEDIIKRSLGSAGAAESTVLSEQLITNNSKGSNSAGGLFSLSLSQQYALQQKEINERAAQYYNQSQSQQQQKANSQGHLSQGRESLENAQQTFEQPVRQQFQKGNGQQLLQQQLRGSPLNQAISSNGVQNAPSTDYISTAKKPKNTTIPIAASKNQPGRFFNKTQN